MRFDISARATDGVLAGSTEGQKILLSILGECKTPPPTPSILVIDFKGVDIATASFLRECVFSLKDLMRAHNSDWYPVLANTCSEIEDELSILTRVRRDAIVLCNYDEDGKVSNRRLFGHLDSMHKRTFDLVAEKGEADAVSLARAYGDEEQLLNPTAWNNRLKTLAERGLLMEFTRGRAKTYRPAW